MTLKELLADRKLTSALIVDDAYDTTPRALDIVAEDAWSNFFADLGEDRQQLVELFPPFEVLKASQLRESDEFVSSVWKARGRIRPELWDLLFDTYEQATRSDRLFLGRLEEALKSLGITPIPCGRQVAHEQTAVPLIFADLFLGAAQETSNIELSLAKLRDLLRGREDDPPLVILMSRSHLLEDKKAHFRDEAKLLGAMFRVYRKHELLEGATFERALERLALHRPDAMRVARFLHCWEKGLADASARFLKGIRRLDLSDYAQIREVLLDFEGQPLGSYLLDVFDRVLQHEIEGDDDTVKAAESLNQIDPEVYPAPYISGSIDLQDLVYRSIWQHPMRLKVNSTIAAVPVGFGDVLIRRTILNATPGSADADDQPDALAVLTAACDLVREGGSKRILLLGGKLATLTPNTWTYSGDMIKTPIIVLDHERRMWIRWNVKDVRTLQPNEVETLLRTDGTYQIALRLRETHALELQQRLLSSMGRIGLVTPLPGTFPVQVSAYYFDGNGMAQPLTLPKTDQEGGVCYTGRDANAKENTRLVLTEQVIDELLTAISCIPEEDVNPKSLETLKKLKASRSLAADLERGFKVPTGGKSGFQHIKALVANNDLEAVEEIVGLIARNPTELKTNQPKYEAFALVLRDEQPEGREAQ